MKKYLSWDSRYWVEDDERGNFNLGVTNEGLSQLGVLSNFVSLTKTGIHVKRDQKLFAIETNKCLQSFKCPMDGKLMFVSKDLENNPCDINERSILASFKDADVTGLNRIA